MVPSTKEAKGLSLKQDLVLKLFTHIATKQEIGKLTALEIEQVMTIAETAAEKILALKG